MHANLVQVLNISVNCVINLLLWRFFKVNNAIKTAVCLPNLVSKTSECLVYEEQRKRQTIEKNMENCDNLVRGIVEQFHSFWGISPTKEPS